MKEIISTAMILTISIKLGSVLQLSFKPMPIALTVLAIVVGWSVGIMI